MSDTIDPTAEQAPAVPPSTEQAPADDFDKERALETIRKQRQEEKALRAQLKELEALKAEKEQRDQAELTEAERLRKELNKLSAAHATATAELRNARVLNAARAAADALGLALHPGALDEQITLGALADLEADEHGQFKGLKTALKELTAAKPWLLKPAPASADLDGQTRGKTSKADMDDERRRGLAARFGIRNTGS